MAVVKTDSQYYSHIAAAIRSKSGTNQQYKPAEMSGAILGLETGGQNSTIIVYAPTGAQVTAACGDDVRTSTENEGVWRFPNCGLGTWLITASKDGLTNTASVEIKEKGQLMRYEVGVSLIGIFGIMRDITSSSPLWTRTDVSENFSAVPSVATTSGYSDFDNYYPWREIRRETLSTGDVMVRIPKFWYRRYREGNTEYLKIADRAQDGYKLHPAFKHAGVETDAIYVGVYKTSAEGKSVSGVAPYRGVNRGQHRSVAKSKGAGWGIVDIATLSALQMLYLVEYATYNCQKAIGRGVCDTNAVKNTGLTDDMYENVGHTGRLATEDSGAVNMLWRGLEDLWGNVLEYVDGLIPCGTQSKYYVCNDPSAYSDSSKSAYAALSYSMPAVTSYTYISRVGLDSVYDYIMLPSEASGADYETYICDAMIQLSNYESNSAKYGGKYFSTNKTGLFKLQANSNYSATDNYCGSRLLFIPQQVSA